VLCIIFGVTQTVSLAGREGKTSGGFIIGYPTDHMEQHSEMYRPGVRTEEKRVRRTLSVMPDIEIAEQQEENDINVKLALVESQKVVLALKQTLDTKNKKIQILERRVDALSSKLEEKEAELYLVQPKAHATYEVRRGDNLWKIAKRTDVYGNPYMWIKIYNANMDKIQNVNLIYPGQLFEIPK